MYDCFSAKSISFPFAALGFPNFERHRYELKPPPVAQPQIPLRGPGIQRLASKIREFHGEYCGWISWWVLWCGYHFLFHVFVSFRSLNYWYRPLQWCLSSSVLKLKWRCRTHGTTRSFPGMLFQNNRISSVITIHFQLNQLQIKLHVIFLQ